MFAAWNLVEKNTAFGEFATLTVPLGTESLAEMADALRTNRTQPNAHRTDTEQRSVSIDRASL